MDAQEKRRAKSSEISALKKEQSKRLKALALGAGFPAMGAQAALAAATGINFRTIGSYWCGHRRILNDPPDMSASKIVAAINAKNPKRQTTVDYLVSGKVPMYVTESTQSDQKARKPLPLMLFSSCDAEYLLKLKNNESFAWSREIKIMEPELILGEYADSPQPPILFEAPDRSMEPMIPSGAKAVVSLTAPYVAGDTVLACPPGMDAAMIRQYRIKQRAREKMQRILHPLNNANGAFEDIEIEDCSCIIGPVVLIISRPK